MKIIQSGKQGVAFNRVLSVSSALLLRNQKNSLHWNPSSKYLGTISQYNGRLLTTVYSLRIYALPMLEIKKPCSKQTNMRGVCKLAQRERPAVARASRSPRLN